MVEDFTSVGTPVALALGSNLGDRLGFLSTAVASIAAAMQVEAASSIYESAPVGHEDQGPFLNAVVVGRTRLSPGGLLGLAQRVEAEAERQRPFPGAPRTLDVDLILYGDRVIRRTSLIVPHPRFRERSFVLAPLAEVAPDWVDPGTGRTVLELWQMRRDDLPPVRMVAPAGALTGR